jgi:hypothetical protein
MSQVFDPIAIFNATQVPGGNRRARWQETFRRITASLAWDGAVPENWADRWGTILAPLMERTCELMEMAGTAVGAETLVWVTDRPAFGNLLREFWMFRRFNEVNFPNLVVVGPEPRAISELTESEGVPNLGKS